MARWQTCAQLMVVAVMVLAALLLASGCGGGSDSSEPSPYAGQYEGTFAGDQAGTWTATVSTSGKVDLTIVLDGDSYDGSGNIGRSGTAHLVTSGTGTGGFFTATWDGAFVQDGDSITGSGTWSDDWDQTGTWEGQRTAAG